MFRKIYDKISCYASYISCKYGVYVIMCAVLCLCALAVRVFTKGDLGYLFHSLNKGLFPSPFFYSLFHIIRICLCGIVLSNALFCPYSDNRFRSVIYAAIASAVLLFEYKLIYGMLQFFGVIMLSVCGGIALFFSLLEGKNAHRGIVVCAFLFLILQSVFIVQLVTLIFCM